MGNVFSCKICFKTKFKSRQFAKNERCGHTSFCKECIAKHIISQLDEHEISKIKCLEFGCKESLDAGSCNRLLSKPKFARWRATVAKVSEVNRNARLRGLVDRVGIDTKLATYSVSKGLQQCPWCKHFVERNGGCSYVRCRCGVEFCYTCGLQTHSHAHSGGCHKRVAILSELK